MKIQDLRIGDTVTVKGHDFSMKIVGLFGDKDVQLWPCVEDYEGDVWEEDVADLVLVKPRYKPPNAISTPDPAEFVKQLISPLRWVKGKGPVLTYAKVLRTKYEIERQTHGDGFVLYLGRYPLRTYASIDKAKEGAKQNLDESILKVLKL